MSQNNQNVVSQSEYISGAEKTDFTVSSYPDSGSPSQESQAEQQQEQNLAEYDLRKLQILANQGLLEDNKWDFWL